MSKSGEDIEDLSQCLQGNLCRCTGYRPILEAFQKISDKKTHFEVKTLDNSTLSPLVLNKTWFVPKDLAEVKRLMTDHYGKFEFCQGGTGKYHIKQIDVNEPTFHISLGLVVSLQKIEVSLFLFFLFT